MLIPSTACQLTEHVQGGHLMHAAFEGCVGALTGVNDSVHVLRHVDLELGGGGGAAPQAHLRGLHDVRHLDRYAIPPPGQLCRRITGAGITTECRLHVRRQLLRFYLDLHRLGGKVHAQRNGFEEGNLRGRIVGLASIPRLVVSDIGQDRQLRGDCSVTRFGSCADLLVVQVRGRVVPLARQILGIELQGSLFG